MTGGGYKSAMTALTALTAMTVWSCLIISVLGDSTCPRQRTCTDWRQCDWYMQFRKLKQTNNAEYRRRLPEIRQSVCNNKPQKICCPTTIRPTRPPTPSTRPTRPPIPPINFPTGKEFSPSWIPSMAKKECGDNHGTQFIVGGEDTEIGELPWAVLLGRNDKGSVNWYCGGSLINRWYVVTAAHCKRPDVVRVGEWRVVDATKPDREHGLVFSDEQLRSCRRRNRNCKNFRLFDSSRDCVNESGKFVYSAGGRDVDCGPPHQDFSVAGYIDHPQYGSLISGVVINDIALIKLDRPVRLDTEGQSNIVPICLPIPGTIEGSPTNIGEPGSGFHDPKGLVVGWGKTYDGTDRLVSASVNSVTQKKLEMPLVSNDQCGTMLSNIFKVDISDDIRSEYHLCGGGVPNQDSCNGDSGGPLIYRRNANSPYWLAGTVSFGTKTCGIGAPAVFTRITSYVSWIRQNLT